MSFPPIRPFVSIIAIVCLTFGALAAEPMLEKIDLFQAGDQGFALYRIPGVVVTAKGSVLTYCEARKDSGSDWGEIQVHLRRSTDGGHSWTPAKHIAHQGERIQGNPTKAVGGESEQTVNNPVAIVDHKTGAVHFLYCVNYARCFYMRSDDDGVSFSAPVEITDCFQKYRETCDWKVLATGPGHGIQLKSGRLVVPIWIAYGKVGAHSPSMSGTIYSDDHGKTWRAGELAFPNQDDWKNPNETAIAELSDGRVMLNARTSSNANRRLVSVSADGSTHWSEPQFDAALFDPKCMGSLLSIPGTKEHPGPRLMFSNPHNLKWNPDGSEVPGASGGRKNLTIKISEDDGSTWPVQKTLEDGSSAYSDLAVMPDGTMLCFYERLGYKALTLARFNAAWLGSSTASEAARPTQTNTGSSR